MDLSVIIVEYKSIDLIRSAKDSLRKRLSPLNYELIVVSNSLYPTEYQRQLLSEFSDAIMIFNEDNAGFARANNQGIKRSTGEFLLLINPDAELMNDGLRKAIDCMKSCPSIAALGPRIIDGSGAVQDSCRNFMTPSRLVMRTLKRMTGLQKGGVLETATSAKKQPVDWISGACMLVRRRAVEQVGMMDERFFMYMEDMDWCRRFWSAGWQVWYDFSWQVVHNASRSSTSTFRLTNRLMWIHLQSYAMYLLKCSGKPLVRRDPTAGKDLIDHIRMSHSRE